VGDEEYVNVGFPDWGPKNEIVPKLFGVRVGLFAENVPLLPFPDKSGAVLVVTGMSFGEVAVEPASNCGFHKNITSPFVLFPPNPFSISIKF